MKLFGCATVEKRRYKPFSVLLVGLVFVCYLVAGTVLTTQETQAETPPDSCFNFISGSGMIIDYYDNENNDSGQPACARNVDIPATIGGNAVTAIGMNAFAYNNLNSVTIPSSVTALGQYSFRNNNLTSVNIPSSVTTIALGAFYDNNLTTVTVPSTVIDLQEYVFAVNEITSVTLPTGMTSIPQGTFWRNQLTSINIPSSVTTINDNAFDTNQLASVTIPNSVTTIGSEAFASNKLTAVNIEGTPTIGSSAFILNGTTPEDSIAWLAANPSASQADYYNSHISFVPVYMSSPSGYVSTAYWEADSSYDLNYDGDTNDVVGGYIINPTKITKNYRDISNNDLQAPEITVGDGLSSYMISENTDGDMTKYHQIGGSATITAPASLTGLALVSPSPFNLSYLVANMNSHTFLYSNDNIGSTTESCFAFDGSGTILGYYDNENNDPGQPACPKTVVIPSIIGGSLVTVIGVNAFYAKQITSVVIPASVTAIDGQAFLYNNLTSVIIPSSVTSIGMLAFAGNQLTSLTIEGSPVLSPVAFAFNGVVYEEVILLVNPVDMQNYLDSHLTYVPIYTSNISNPAGYTDTRYLESDIGADMNGDGDTDDTAGGYIINPSQLTVNYRDGSNNSLQTSDYKVGSSLTNYLVSSNPTADFGQYYHAGGSVVITAPVSLTGLPLVSVSPFTLSSLVPGLNTHSFVYAQNDDGDEGSNNNGGNGNPVPSQVVAEANPLNKETSRRLASLTGSLSDSNSIVQPTSGTDQARNSQFDRDDEGRGVDEHKANLDGNTKEDNAKYDIHWLVGVLLAVLAVVIAITLSRSKRQS